MSKYQKASSLQTVLGGALSLLAVATMPTWLPLWEKFVQWMATIALHASGLIIK